MDLLILGVGAGGGFPQWNCRHPTSQAAREGRAQPRTQSSIALTVDGLRYVLCNASPDLTAQIRANPCLQPHPNETALRHSPIEAVVLTNADVDHIAGLLSLRESQPLVIYASDPVLRALDANPIFRVLNPNVVQRKLLNLEEITDLRGPTGESLRIKIRAFAVPAKVALWLEDASRNDYGSTTGDGVGLEILDEHEVTRGFYIPGCSALPPALAERLRRAPFLLFDGTLWQDWELVDAGISTKTGQRMGHMSVSGPDGSLRQFEPLAIDQKVFIHINTTNPMLIDGSPEAQQVHAAGWHIAQDNQRFTL